MARVSVFLYLFRERCGRVFFCLFRMLRGEAFFSLKKRRPGCIIKGVRSWKSVFVFDENAILEICVFLFFQAAGQHRLDFFL